MSKLIEGDLSDEEWREYELGGGRVYRIHDPKTLYTREGGSTHRVLDQYGVVHLVPGPGYRDCVIRWKVREGRDPVAF